MTRLISGIALAAAALAAILFLPVFYLRLLLCLVAVLAAHEYLTIVRRGPLLSAVPTLLVVTFACWSFFPPRSDTLVAVILAALVIAALEVLARGETIDRAAVSFLAPWYIGVPLGMLAAIQAMGGPSATILLIATIVVSDSAQYYCGRMFGRRPLAPAISPKKTIEGAIGGVIFGTLFVALAGPRVLPLASPLSLTVLGFTLVVLGVCGDLFESRLKRTSGVKDSSTLIPGHGGVLDRIDALLFASPAYYMYLNRLT